MADEEDDYLSDAFLLAAAETKPSSTRTYAERRREALKLSEQRNLAGRKKSRKELEEEARKEGLSKSLFERAREEGASGSGASKAMNMMLKMGFKEGQALGRESGSTTPISGDVGSNGTRSATPDDSKERAPRVDPLPLGVWAGRKGLGLGKRALSPQSSARAAKAAKLAEETAEGEDREAFRSRARGDYEERRAEGRIMAARRTCVTLDEKNGISFNVLWLDPRNPDTFPPGLIDKLTFDLPSGTTGPGFRGEAGDEDENDRDYRKALRKQMRADALTPLADLDGDNVGPLRKLDDGKLDVDMTPEIVEKASVYLRLPVRQRLDQMLMYLRATHAYCFWCGTQYDNQEEMEKSCPGVDEEAHD